MEYHQRLEDLHAKYGNLEKQAFAAKFKHPFLVVELLGSEGGTGVFKTLEERVNNGERPTEPIDKSKENPLKRHLLAVPLVKSDRNSFRNMTTLGRASNNDVVIEHPSVSKFHAYFREHPVTGKVTVADAGSSYGTVVDGKAVGKDEPRILDSGARLRFADCVTATFLSPVEFYDYMHLHLRVSS
ncbi:MAG: FHA domain-containing protein [Planctomycetota bacterium]|jgi:hypothetical protein